MPNGALRVINKKVSNSVKKNNIKLKCAAFAGAFSLMEMMVVLLIVAIIAAATAPMVTKKLSRGAGNGESPWVFTGLNNSIAYNMNGSNASAIIGATSYRRGVNGPSNPRLVLASGNDEQHPALVFANANGTYSGKINMNVTTGVVTMNGGSGTIGQRSVAIGLAQTLNSTPANIVAIGNGVTSNNNNNVVIGYRGAVNAGGIAIGGAYDDDNGSNTQANTRAIAIGSNALATGDHSVAIGSRFNNNTATTASGTHSVAIGTRANSGSDSGATQGIAIGYRASATGAHSIAIGAEDNTSNRTIASGRYSTAIGAGAQATQDNQIVLGTREETVYIPGNLVVGRNVILNRESNIYHTFLSPGGKSGSGGWWCLASAGDHRTAVINDGVDSYGGMYQRLWTTYSDRRLKNVGEKYTAGLEELKKLDFYHYTFKKDEKKTPMVGVMAQDLQKVFPDAVTKGDDGFLRIRFEDMFYAVINAVKELDNKITEIVENVKKINSTIEEQQKTIEAQQKVIEELQTQNAEFEKRLKKLEKSEK